MMSASHSYSDDKTPSHGREQSATRALALSLKARIKGSSLKVGSHMWRANYSIYALLTRIALRPVPERNMQVLNTVPEAIDSIKHFYLNGDAIEENTYGASVRAGLNQEDFNTVMRERFSQFTEIEEDQLGPLWPGFKKGLGAMKLKMIENQVEGSYVHEWETSGAFSTCRNRETVVVLDDLCTAFVHDMQNGTGNMFFQQFSSFLAKSMDVDGFLRVTTPVSYDNDGSNTKVELLSAMDEENVMRSYSQKEPYLPCEMNRSDSEKEDLTWPLTKKGGYPHQRAKLEIPDIVWSTMETDVAKGEFLLVLEIQPATGTDHGVFQCYKQLLSKMHFQTFGFGLVITPIRFVQIAAIKEGDKISFYDFSMPFRGSMDEKWDHAFDIRNFTVLAKWLGGLLQYAKNKCYESEGHSTEVTSQKENN